MNLIQFVREVFVEIRDHSGRTLLQTLGVILGVGLKPTPTDNVDDNQISIGHMWHLNPAMLFGKLGCIDAALKALDIRHGSGALEAACAWIASTSKDE